ncbi:hypothetical protein B0H10DRAFT_1950988 [Mycena sp. CBHHK59/15]|nr:hypothetical protein B0H10DRAFT_1950988 [Mycena sp. CBHHK59/15]
MYINGPYGRVTIFFASNTQGLKRVHSAFSNPNVPQSGACVPIETSAATRNERRKLQGREIRGRGAPEIEIKGTDDDEFPDGHEDGTALGEAYYVPETVQVDTKSAELGEYEMLKKDKRATYIVEGDVEFLQPSCAKSGDNLRSSTSWTQVNGRETGMSNMALQQEELRWVILGHGVPLVLRMDSEVNEVKIGWAMREIGRLKRGKNDGLKSKRKRAWRNNDLGPERSVLAYDSVKVLASAPQCASNTNKRVDVLRCGSFPFLAAGNNASADDWNDPVRLTTELGTDIDARKLDPRRAMQEGIEWLKAEEKICDYRRWFERGVTRYRISGSVNHANLRAGYFVDRVVHLFSRDQKRRANPEPSASTNEVDAETGNAGMGCSTGLNAASASAKENCVSPTTIWEGRRLTKLLDQPRENTTAQRFWGRGRTVWTPQEHPLHRESRSSNVVASKQRIGDIRESLPGGAPRLVSLAGANTFRAGWVRLKQPRVGGTGGAGRHKR